MKKYRWIAQDSDGSIYKYKEKPSEGETVFYGAEDKLVIDQNIDLPNWRKSLIDRTKHDYKIKDGLLVRVDKPARHEYADVFIECANDKSKVLQFKTKTSMLWQDSLAAQDGSGIEWRIKPQDQPE